MADHVVMAIHRVHSLETNRAVSLSLILVGLQCVIVVFPDHTHLLFSYSPLLLIKIQQKSEIGLSCRWGGVSCNFYNKEYKACGKLTSTVWSVVAGHVVIAIHRHRVHTLETNRARPISRQILVLSEHNLFTLNRKRSGSVVERLTQDRRAVGSSLTGVTALWSLSKTHLS